MGLWNGLDGYDGTIKTFFTRLELCFLRGVDSRLLVSVVDGEVSYDK